MVPLEGTARRIAQAILNGGTTVETIRATTGLSESSLSHHLSKLITSGLVSCEGRRPYRGLRPTAALPERLSGLD